jgi:rod shape-determining protein MreD
VAVVRVVLVAALLATVLLLQLTVLAFFDLPGATPDLLLVTVAALGLAAGPGRGAVAGFCGGLLLDLAPPATGLLGLSALVLTVVGYVAGVLGERRDRSAVVTTVQVALLAGAAVVGYAIVGGVVADPRIAWDRVPVLAVTQVLYAGVLAAFVVPLVALLVRRLEPTDSGYELGRYER